MRRVLVVFCALVAAALAFVQFGSDAIFVRAGVASSLPAHLQPAFGVAVYRRIAAVAPAPYADAMLARAALEAGDTARARTYALRLPESAKRNDLLGQVAQARGDERSAQEYFVRAGDIEAIARAVDRVQRSDPARAYALEDALRRRLQQSGTHPDAVAEAYWQLGQLAWQQSKRGLAVKNYARAVSLSPLSEKYLLSAGFAAYDTGDAASAQHYFSRVLAVNPASADAYAGAGMVALQQGDRAAAQADAQRARLNDPHSHALAALDAKLHP